MTTILITNLNQMSKQLHGNERVCKNCNYILEETKEGLDCTKCHTIYEAEIHDDHTSIDNMPAVWFDIDNGMHFISNGRELIF